MNKVQGFMIAFNAVPVTSVPVKLGMVHGSNTGKSILLKVVCVSLSCVRGDLP